MPWQYAIIVCCLSVSVPAMVPCLHKVDDNPYGRGWTMSRTKPHKISQYPTLSIEQHNAIDLLILGHTDHAVAEQIGVARETVCRWRNENPYFMAELNRRRKDVWQTAHETVARTGGEGHRHRGTGAKCPTM